MSRWKDRRRIAMLQCNVQTRTCSPRRSVIAGMAVLASQLGKLWTLCPVDVEEDGGEGEMVRGEEPFWRRTKAKAGGASMHVHASALAGLRVPVVPCLRVCPCARVPVCLGGGCGSEWMDPARCVHTCCRSPRNFISQDWIRPGLAKVQGVRDWQDKQAEIERAKPKPREGVSVVQGPLSVSLTLTLAVSVPIHTIRAQIPPHTSFARFGGASGAR